MDNELTTITKINWLDKCTSDSITDDTLLLVECPQYGDGVKSHTGYVTKSITYGDLKKNIKDSLNLNNFGIYTNEVLRDLHVPKADVSIKNTDNNMYVISAFYNTGRGVITALSTYNLYRTMSDRFNKNEFNNISATHSPWIKKSDLTNEKNGQSLSKVVTQNVISNISDEMDSNYLHKDSIVGDIGESETQSVVTQKLVSELCSHIESLYAQNSNIGMSFEYGSDYIANLSCVKILFDGVNDKCIISSDITYEFNKLSDKTDKIVAEKAIYDLSSYISSRYISSRYATDNYLTWSDNYNIIGYASDKSASQKLIYDLSNDINSQLYVIADDGKVLYCGKNNTMSSKYVYQDFAVFLSGIDDISPMVQFTNDVSICEKELLTNIPKYYTLFGDGVTDDNVYILSATANTILEGVTTQTKEVQLTSLYGTLTINDVTISSTDYFDTTKFNVVEEGTFVYNKITGKKFYFIDKNFIQF